MSLFWFCWIFKAGPPNVRIRGGTGSDCSPMDSLGAGCRFFPPREPTSLRSPSQWDFRSLLLSRAQLDQRSRRPWALQWRCRSQSSPFATRSQNCATNSGIGGSSSRELAGAAFDFG